MKHLEKYYEGKGCKCFARSSSECGCHDVDWTPKAVYELRAERDSLQIALEEISNLAKTLKGERDEAREDLEHWKIEYEIVVSRLCGTKHERDNGIIAEHEIIPVLMKERDEARVALMKIEDLFIDGTDIYADRETMGEIAREALEGAK
jgi:hypothetical protein